MKRPSAPTNKSKPSVSKPVPAKRGASAAKPQIARKVAKSSPAKTASGAAPTLSRKSPRAASKPQACDPSRTKQSQLIALLGAPPGASMSQMISLTGWQAHTVRGAISGALRKRLGLNVLCRVEEGVRIYWIEDAEQAVAA